MNSAPAPSQCVADDVAWLKRDAIIECAELLQSFSISLAEAAWRGSDATVEVTLRQIRATLIETISVWKDQEAPRADREAAE